MNSILDFALAGRQLFEHCLRGRRLKLVDGFLPGFGAWFHVGHRDQVNADGRHDGLADLSFFQAERGLREGIDHDSVAGEKTDVSALFPAGARRESFGRLGKRQLAGFDFGAVPSPPSPASRSRPNRAARSAETECDSRGLRAVELPFIGHEVVFQHLVRQVLFHRPLPENLPGQPFFEQRQGRPPLKERLAWQVLWERAVKKYLTDKMLEDYFVANKRQFDGSETRASHILFLADRAAGFGLDREAGDGGDGTAPKWKPAS